MAYELLSQSRKPNNRGGGGRGGEILIRVKSGGVGKSFEKNNRARRLLGTWEYVVRSERVYKQSSYFKSD